MERCRLKRYNFQIKTKMNKENKILDKQQNGNDFIADVSTRFWSVVEKRGQVYHEVKSYKRKQDAVTLLIKLKSESLTDYQLVSISNGC